MSWFPLSFTHCFVYDIPCDILTRHQIVLWTQRMQHEWTRWFVQPTNWQQLVPLKFECMTTINQINFFLCFFLFSFFFFKFNIFFIYVSFKSFLFSIVLGRFTFIMCECSHYRRAVCFDKFIQIRHSMHAFSQSVSRLLSTSLLFPLSSLSLHLSVLIVIFSLWLHTNLESDKWIVACFKHAVHKSKNSARRLTIKDICVAVWYVFLLRWLNG